jgi:hypothetical protein
MFPPTLSLLFSHFLFSFSLPLPTPHIGLHRWKGREGRREEGKGMKRDGKRASSVPEKRGVSMVHIFLSIFFLFRRGKIVVRRRQGSKEEKKRKEKKRKKSSRTVGSLIG